MHVSDINLKSCDIFSQKNELGLLGFTVVFLKKIAQGSERLAVDRFNFSMRSN
jgi:hypothetical protein